MPGLGSSHPLGGTLPGLYHEDLFAQRLCSGLDEVLAPIFATLDSLSAYLDPRTAPDDMLGWLAGWIGLALDDGQSPRRQRELVRAGAELLRWRGTARGIRDAVETLFEVAPELIETGGAAWSPTSGAGFPGQPGTRLVVRLRVPDIAAVDMRRFDAVVAAVKPAHVPHRVEVVATADA